MARKQSRPEYWTGGHTTHRLRYHIVFTPKYRRRVLDGRLADRLSELFHEACATRRWQLVELSIQPDHVHMMIQLSPTDNISNVMQVLKGRSSFVIRKEFPALEEFLWGEHLWADGYFAVTIGAEDEAVVRKYIRNQDTPGYY